MKYICFGGVLSCCSFWEGGDCMRDDVWSYRSRFVIMNQRRASGKTSHLDTHVHMHLPVCRHACTHTRACTYTHVHTHIQASTHVYPHTGTHTCTCTYTHICTHTCLTHVCTHMHSHTCTHTHIHMCSHTNMSTHTYSNILASLPVWQ